MVKKKGQDEKEKGNKDKRKWYGERERGDERNY
jgi:hypothetical protein